MTFRSTLAAVVLSLAALLGASCASDPPADSLPSDSLPRFEAGADELAELVGTTFSSGSLPALLGGGDPSALAGSVIVNAERDPSDPDTVALHWLVDGSIANFVVSTIDGRDDTTAPIWRPGSTWKLHLPPDAVVTVGTTVCAAPIHSYDWQDGEFVAVVNRAQDQALGAWTLTRSGPTPYADLATLECQRFVP